MNATSDNLGFLRNIPKVRFAEEDNGYNKSQVDRVLESIAPVADAVEELQARLADAHTRVAAAEAKLAERPESVGSAARAADADQVIDPDFDETLRKTLLLAQRAADATTAEAESDAIATRALAESDASDILNQASEEAEAMVASARSEQTSMQDETAATRVRLMDEAQTEASARRDQLQADLDSSVGAARDELAAQATDLTKIRDHLAQDVEDLEVHLAERRSTIRTALASLEEATEGPGGLGSVDAPVYSDADASDPQFGERVQLDELDPVSAAPDTSFTFGNDGGGAKTEMIDVVKVVDESDVATPVAPSADVGLTRFVPTSAERSGSDPDSLRPAWADSVPDVEEAPGTPLDTPESINDKLSKLSDGVADSSDTAEEEALARFLDQPSDDGKTGWFGRRK